MSPDACVRLIGVVALCAAIGAAIALALLPKARDAILGATGLGAMGYAVSDTNPSHRLRTTGTARIGGSFKLITHNATAITDKDLRGQYLMVFFGTTSSGTVTPAALQTMTATLDGLGNAAQSFRPIFISLDPEHDTVARLAPFIASFHSRFLALTGDRAEIERLAKTYFVDPAPRPSAANSTTSNSPRTSYIYIMDRNGLFLMHLSFATPVADMVNRLRRLR